MPLTPSTGSGASSWSIIDETRVQGFGTSYQLMNYGSVQVRGAPDSQTPIAMLRVGYTVVFPVSTWYPSGATLKITAIDHTAFTAPGTPSGANALYSGGRLCYDGLSISFSDGSVWGVKTIARWIGAGGCSVTGTTAKDLAQTQ